MSRKQRFSALLVAAAGALAILALPGAAAAKDRNHDRIPDRWEKRHHLSLQVNQAHRNQDHEGLDNREEFENGTNPRDADTDDDNLTDSQEVEVGDDPNDADTDNDGVEDGDENAGTISSFDGTTLTIDLFGGGTLSGQVTESTEIECDQEDGGAQVSEDGQNQDQQGGEDSGSQQSSDDGDAGTCGTADLMPGAAVHEADLEGTAFTKVELAG
jgi:hypothetical protein